jgi:hypothetical protein
LDGLSREELISTILKQHEVIERLRDRVSALETEVEFLRSQLGSGGNAPEWVKPNRKQRREQERSERKRRKQSFVRGREPPTEIVRHVVDRCPDCGRGLAGGWVHRVRQVIEIPDTPVRIIEHQLIARRCGVCGKVHIPKLDLSGEVVGKHRVGMRLMSLVAKLHTECRVPLRAIQDSLRTLYGLRLSLGELSEILHTVARLGKSACERLLNSIRGSPVVNADETGWREGGLNGYIWSLSTPDARYFAYNRSRSGEVVKELFGEDFAGVVVCDFYCAYNVLLSRRQRCWAHFVRDLKKLREENADDQDVVDWVDTIIGVYRRAKRFTSKDANKRLNNRIAFEDKLLELAMPYVKSNRAQHVLAERIERFLPELFVFVEDPRVPSTNNAAERAVRPSVIARKVSGGTRSAKGSTTAMSLMSLFGTWKLRGLDTLEACRQLLADSQTKAQPQTV